MTWEDTGRHKPLPDPVLEALRQLDAAPEDAIYVGDTAWDIRAGRAAGVVTGAALWGVAGADELLAEEPDLVLALARGGAAVSQQGPGRRAARAARRGQLPLQRARPADRRRRHLRRLDARASRPRGRRTPSLVTPDSPTQRVGATPSGDFAQVTHRQPMLSLANARNDDELRAWVERAQRRSADEHDRVGGRAQDRRPRDLAHLRARRVRARRDARRRRGRRGRHSQPPHHLEHPAAAAPRPRRGAARGGRGARRGVPAAAGVCPGQRGARRGGAPHVHEPAQLGRRARCGRRIRRSPPGVRCACGSMPSATARGSSWARTSRRSSGCARMACACRTEITTHTDVEAVVEACRAWEARRAELDYDIDGAVVKVSSFAPAAAARHREPRPALGDRLQVRADHCDHHAAVDRRERRPHRRAQPVCRARAGRRGRRDGVARHPPQRGGHQPQGHPRGRHGDRAARRRRDPAGGRPADARGREAKPAVEDAHPLPELRHAGGEARGRGEAPLSQPCLSRDGGSSTSRTSCRAGRWISTGSARSWSTGWCKTGLVSLPPDFYKLTMDDLLALDGFQERSASNVIESIAGSRERPFGRLLFGARDPACRVRERAAVGRLVRLDRRADRGDARRDRRGRGHRPDHRRGGRHAGWQTPTTSR